MLGRRASVGIYGGNLSWIFTSNGAKISAQIFIDIYINVDIRGRCKKKEKKLMLVLPLHIHTPL